MSIMDFLFRAWYKNARKPEAYLKVSLDFSNIKDADFVVFCRGVYTHMKGNGKFPKPPIDLDVFNQKVGLYGAAITRALDGGKKAISERNRLRAEVIHMVTQLGHYVSYMSADLATLYTSGFEPAYKLRRLP